MVSLSEITSEANRFGAELAARLAGEEENRFQGMPSDGDSRAGYRAMGEGGWIGLHWPEELGGRGLDPLLTVAAEERFGYHWLPLSSYLLSVKTIGNAMLDHASAELQERLLPEIAAGRLVFCQGFSEPEAGSDLASLRTTARRDGDGWRIDGRKQFITNARYAPFAIVLARLGAMEPQRTSSGITAFVVPLDAPGVSLGPSEQKHGLRASDTSALILEDARVGRDALLGEEGKGFAIAMSGLDGGRIGIAAQSVGIARRALEVARAYAKERRQFGRPIADFEGLRFRLAKADSDLSAARLLALRAAWLRDRGRPFTREAAMAKLYASEMAQRATHAAVQILGGNGYMRDYAVERYARDGRATTIYEGTSEIQRIVIARSLLAAA